FLHPPLLHPALPSFPTRRSSDLLTTPPTLELMRAVRAARRTLDAGFTTVRDAAGTPAGVRMAIDAGYFPGPRMFVTVSALSQTRSEEHTSELQSLAYLVCRLLLE